MDRIILKTRQQRINNTLLLNSSFLDNLGLMHGKIGIAVSFFHLARENDVCVYENYAGDLLNEIFAEISAKTPFDFENGLASIGWGIEYLAQQGFIEANTDDILKEFDNKLISQIKSTDPDEVSLLTGLSGYIIYFLNRIKTSNKIDEFVDAIRLSTGIIFKHVNEKESYISQNWNEPDTR